MIVMKLYVIPSEVLAAVNKILQSSEMSRCVGCVLPYTSTDTALIPRRRELDSLAPKDGEFLGWF